MRLAHTLIMASVAAAVGLAACSSTASPTVAKLGTGATSTTVAAAGTANGATSKSSGGSGVASSSGAPELSKMEAYAGCMRSHGVPAFPDPTPGPNDRGGAFAIRGGPGTGLDPNSPTFAAAQQACRSLLPNGGVAKPLTAAQQAAFLAWAACIRSHGVPNFPDPHFSGGMVSIGAGPGNGPDPNSPTFQAARQACKSKLPGGFGGLG